MVIFKLITEGFGGRGGATIGRLREKTTSQKVINSNDLT